MVWDVERLGVAVDHDFGRPAVPTRGIGRVLVALTLPPGCISGMGCIAVNQSNRCRGTSRAGEME